MVTSPRLPISGKARPVTLLRTRPVPLTFCAVMVPGVAAVFGATGGSAHASPRASGRANAATRGFITIASFRQVGSSTTSGGKSSTAADFAAAVTASTATARTFTFGGTSRPAARGDGPSSYVLPFLFYVSTFILTLGIRAGAIALPFFPLHGARLVRARLPRVIRVESHSLSSP